MKPAIQCEYSCQPCGIVRQKVTVPQRGAENVVEWLEQVCVPRLIADHRMRSPMCPVTRLTEVWIPTPEGTEKIGALPPEKPKE